MSISRKELESVICIACGKAYGDHARSEKASKFSIRSLMECMFRIQGTYVSDGIDNAPESSAVPHGDSSNGSKGVDDIPPLSASVPDDIMTGEVSPEEYNDVAYVETTPEEYDNFEDLNESENDE